MDVGLKKILKPVTLALRHLLEGKYDGAGQWKPGDLEQRLAALGVRRDRASVPTDELGHLQAEDRHARKVVDAYIKLREEAGVARSDAVAEFIRETAYTWANRLIALRCMEARELIDPVILQQEAYGGRSLEHHRLAQRHPELCAGEDDGLFAVLDKVFREQTMRLPMLFDPQAPGIALRPSAAAIKDCFGLLSLTTDVRRKYRIRIKEDETANADAELASPFVAPDALGWTYQYWNTEEKDRVFTKVRTQRTKIDGADIIPATQLYTEPYMIKFLVQNSLGATWIEMNPESKLAGGWDYFVRDADRAPALKKPVAEITLIDPAVGSGHFLLEAFDLFWGMYEEEGINNAPEAIAAAILNNNLFGIDIDERAVQIAQAALWMTAKERAPDLAADAILGFHDHLIACNFHLPRGEDHVRVFLDKHPEDAPIRHALPAIFEGLAHANELGALLKVEEIVEGEIAAMRRDDPLFAYSMAAEGWGGRVMARLREHFAAESQAADLVQAFFSRSAGNGLALFGLLARRYDIVTANPPWMGSKNMGLVSKRYLELHYGPGKRDLYAAFILRNLELAVEGGRVAMVTQQSWMFLSTFASLRVAENGSPQFHGILRESNIEALAQLGRYAFSELGNGVIQPALFILFKSRVLMDNSIKSFRLSAPRLSHEQSALLRSAVSGREKTIESNPKQSDFLRISGSPLCYWLREKFFRILAMHSLGERAIATRQVDTCNNNRFLRYYWETEADSDRWLGYLKAGGYGRWFGYDKMSLNWYEKGLLLKQSLVEKFPYLKGDPAWLVKEQSFFKTGWTYTLMARASLGVRLLDGNRVCDSASPTVLPSPEFPGLGAILNCRLVSYLLRSMSADVKFREGYISRVPLPEKSHKTLEQLESSCVYLKRLLIALDPTERIYDPCLDRATLTEAVSSILHTLEGISEARVFADYEVAGGDLVAVLEETGTPAGWHSLIAGYDAVPQLPEGPQTALFDGPLDHPRRSLSATEGADLKRRLKAMYSAGFGGSAEDDEPELASGEDDESEESVTNGTRLAVMRPDASVCAH